LCVQRRLDGGTPRIGMLRSDLFRRVFVGTNSRAERAATGKCSPALEDEGVY